MLKGNDIIPDMKTPKNSTDSILPSVGLEGYRQQFLVFRVPYVIHNRDHRYVLPAIPPPDAIWTWEQKDFYEVVRDLTVMVASCQTGIEGTFNSRQDSFSFKIPPSCHKYLLLENENQHTVYDFIEKTYPNARVEQDDNLERAFFGERTILIDINRFVVSFVGI